jgi:molecular chaperone DnaK
MADSLIHSTKQTLEELKDEVNEDEKTTIETAISALEEAMKADDKEAIDAKVQALSEAAQPLAQKSQAQAGAGEDGFTDAANAGATEDVMDADFEEVDETKDGK